MHAKRALSRCLRRCGAAALLLGVGVGAGLGCQPETDHLPDNTVAQVECGQKLRVDAQVKAQAIADFADVKKRCEPYDLQVTPRNQRETLWHACCGGEAFNYIYYPEKCVVRKAAGPVACLTGTPAAPAQE